MMNPISASDAAAHANYAAEHAASKQPHQAHESRSSDRSHQVSRQPDKVTIKENGGAADHDGDTK